MDEKLQVRETCLGQSTECSQTFEKVVTYFGMFEVQMAILEVLLRFISFVIDAR
jgi:hypothetical protein